MARRTLLEGRSILLVEDEMMVAMLLQSVFENEGCNVICVGHLAQATLLAQERVFDAAVLDVNLHGQRSYPVADALAARGIPFVFSTGYRDVDIAVLYPGRPFVTKPYEPDALISVLAALIATASGNH